MAKRAAEAGAGFVAATKGLAIQNYMANQNAHRRRVEDSHLAGMKAMGVASEDLIKPGDDDVGDVIVTGDVYGDEAVAMLSANKPSATEPTPKSTLADTLADTLGKAALTAALIGGGAAGGAAIPWALGMFEKPAAVTPVDTDTTTQIEIE